jgi:AcrR family transcriptional regulator
MVVTADAAYHARAMADSEVTRKRDPQRTRANLLAAAIREFSRHGLSGGRVDRIAALARTNKQSIYRYFGKKKNLFRAAMQHVLTADLDKTTPPGEPLHDLEELVDELFDRQRRRPEVTRFLLWEVLEVGEAGPERQSIFRGRSDVVRRGIAEGRFDPTLDPEQTIADISGLCQYAFLMAPSYRILTGRSMKDDAEFERRRRHVHEIVRRILLAPASA